jgi:hypothetical protein
MLLALLLQHAQEILLHIMDYLALLQPDTGTVKWARADVVPVTKAPSVGNGHIIPPLRVNFCSTNPEVHGVVTDVVRALSLPPQEIAQPLLVVSLAWHPLLL